MARCVAWRLASVACARRRRVAAWRWRGVGVASASRMASWSHGRVAWRGRCVASR
ncbi:hypothetical protein ACXZ9C_11770 [Streptococcus agalactiae]